VLNTVGGNLEDWAQITKAATRTCRNAE